jgi:hypothetical protein
MSEIAKKNIKRKVAKPNAAAGGTSRPVSKKPAPRTNTAPRPKSTPQPTVGPKTFSQNAAKLLFVDSNLGNFWWAVGLSFGCFVLFVGVFFWTPDHYNIPATDDYRLIELKPLSEQGNITDNDARDFAGAALTDTLSLSHLNPKKGMNQAFDAYFTANGRSGLLGALSQNGDIDPLTSGRIATLAELRAVPIIEDYRLTNGRFTWVYRVPIRWWWHNIERGERQYADLDVSVFIVRVSQLRKSSGMAVDAVVYGGSQ